MNKALKSIDDSEAARTLALAGEVRMVFGKLHRRLREQASTGDLTSSQQSVLLLLMQEGSMTVTRLARAQGVRPQSMGATIAVLETAGLVKGAPDPADGRQTVLSLTAACQKLIRDVRAAKEDWLFRTIQAKFSSRDKKELAAAVELIQRLVEP